MSGTKRCSKCKQIKPVSEFGKYKRSKDGLLHYCKECSREIGKSWYERIGREKRGHDKRIPVSEEDKRQRRNKYIREWRTKNRDKVLARRRELKKTDKYRAWAKKYRETEKHKRWQEEFVTSGRRAEYCRSRYDPDKERERKKRKYEKDPLKERTRRQESVDRYRAILANADGEYTRSEFIELCESHGNICLRCKRSDIKLTADHVIPMSKGGSNDISNIQPLCGRCNSKKHTNLWDFRLDWT